MNVGATATLTRRRYLLLKLDRDMIERACEQALQGGKHGVLVLRSGVAGPVVSAEVDESVPYGQIHERPLE